MASLEKRYDGRYRIVFCWQGERRYHSLGKTPEPDARSCLNRLEESLRFVDRGLLEIPVNADIGRFRVSGGKLNGKPALKAPITLGELLKRYQAEHPDGAKESSTRSTKTIHIAHLVQIIDPKTAVRLITTETLQGYVNARASEKGRGGRSLSHVTIQKEIGSLSSVWNRWARPLGLVSGPAPTKGLFYAKARAKPPFQTREQIERQIARVGLSALEGYRELRLRRGGPLKRSLAQRPQGYAEEVCPGPTSAISPCSGFPCDCDPESGVEKPSFRVPRPRHPRSAGRVRLSQTQTAFARLALPMQNLVIVALWSTNACGRISSVGSRGSNSRRTPGTDPPGSKGRRP
jgi:hypothetical protein